MLSEMSDLKQADEKNLPPDSPGVAGPELVSQPVRRSTRWAWLWDSIDCTPFDTQRTSAGLAAARAASSPSHMLTEQTRQKNAA